MSQLKLLSVAGLAAFFGIWTLIAISGLVQSQFLPTPLAVAEEFWRLLQIPFAGYTLEQHLLSSLGRFGLGFALAALIGVPLGLAMGWFRTLELIVASSGIGYLMVKGQSNISTAIVMSGMIAIGIVGVAIDVLLRALQARIERHRQ